jgi:VanZ family protein
VLTKIVKSKIAKQINAWLPVILWAALIFRFSSGTIPLASAVHWQDFLVKKTGHILLFGALAVLIYRGLRMEGVSRKRSAIYAVISAILYGATDEYHQMYTQGRESHMRDVFIDGGGATLIILALYYLPPKLSVKMHSVFHKFNLD